MPLIKCCPGCGDRYIKAPCGDRSEWYCPGCLKMFEQPVEREVEIVETPQKVSKRKSKPKISPGQRQARIEAVEASRHARRVAKLQAMIDARKAKQETKQETKQDVKRQDKSATKEEKWQAKIDKSKASWHKKFDGSLKCQ